MKAPFAITLLAAIALAVPAHAKDERDKPNRGMEPVNQPVVQRTDYVFDAEADRYEGIAPQESLRLAQWFDALDLGYGDRVSIAGSAPYRGSNVTSAIADIVGRYGLLLGGEAPATVGEAPAGAIRIVVSRASASVPGCPNFKGRAEADYSGGLSYNYGCAINSNLAAMVADPIDLVEGRGSRSALVGATSGRAIKAFRDAAPSGAGGGKLQ